nr:hypothetical protein WS70_25220 [Burkholderia mayonis]
MSIAAWPRFRIATFRDGGGDGALSARHDREIPDEMRRATGASPVRSTIVHARRSQAPQRYSADAAPHARAARRNRICAPLQRGARRAPRRAAPRNAIARRNSGETFRRAGTAHRAARQGCDDAGLNIAEWQATQCVACGARRRAWRALPIPDITRSDS